MKTTCTILLLALFFFKIQGQGIITIPQHITGKYKLVSSKQYLLDGPVFVDSGAVLTIMPGTVIMAKHDHFNNSSLSIMPYAKIYAIGTSKDPIVFTAYGEKFPQSWGGIYIYGNAPVDGSDNIPKYGGNDPYDNSGIFKYVRIEYGSSFLLGGVGSRTEINHVQVSHSGDSFSFMGGTVNAYYLVAHEARNYFFRTAYGHKGVVQFALGRKSFTSETDVLYSGMDNGQNDHTFFSNLTLYGEDIIGYDIRAILLDNYSKSSIFNSLLINFTFGIVLLGDTAVKNFIKGTIPIKSNDFAVIDSFLSMHSVDYQWIPFSDKHFYRFGNKSYTNLESLRLRNLLSPVPDARPRRNSPVLIGANTSDAIYRYWKPYLFKADYKGAFNSKYDWTKPWTEWHPETFDYYAGGPTIRKQKSVEQKSDAIISIIEENKILQQKSKIKLFPLPANDHVYIRFYTNKEERISIDIIDQNGKTKKSIGYKIYPSGINQLLINIGDLKPGLYIIHLKGTETQEKEKLLIK